MSYMSRYVYIFVHLCLVSNVICLNVRPSNRWPRMQQASNDFGQSSQVQKQSFEWPVLETL